MKDLREFTLPHCMNRAILSSHMSLAPSPQTSIHHLFCSVPKSRRIADYSKFPSTNCSLREVLNIFAAESVEEACRAGRTMKGFSGYAQELKMASGLDRSSLESMSCGSHFTFPEQQFLLRLGHFLKLRSRDAISRPPLLDQRQTFTTILDSFKHQWSEFPMSFSILHSIDVFPPCPSEYSRHGFVLRWQGYAGSRSSKLQICHHHKHRSSRELRLASLHSH
jgi:hypothetical protein